MILNTDLQQIVKVNNKNLTGRVEFEFWKWYLKVYYRCVTDIEDNINDLREGIFFRDLEASFFNKTTEEKNVYFIRFLDTVKIFIGMKFDGTYDNPIYISTIVYNKDYDSLNNPDFWIKGKDRRDVENQSIIRAFEIYNNLHREK